ncbi:MAG: rhodanese-like domain-containing protein [Thiobacillaceae bacterium]
MSKYLTTAIMLSLVGALSVTGCSKQGPKPASGARNFDQVAQAVARREDRVSADDLARWIIEGKKDFVLIDVRSANDYASGHIDGARNVPVPELISRDQMNRLPKDRKVIVYSQGSETAGQAAVLLRVAGYDADLLLGGYNFWTQHVLNPNIPAAQADEESPSGAEQQAIACYFVGGNKLAQAAPPPPPPPKPAFVPPVSTPAAAPLVYPAHNEGC